MTLFVPDMVLDVPLGRWLVSADQLRMRHQFFYEWEDGTVYQRIGNDLEEYWMFAHPVPNKPGVVHRWEFPDETYVDKNILRKAVPLDPYFPRSCTSVQAGSGRR